jgi:hypothetical protein
VVGENFEILQKRLGIWDLEKAATIAREASHSVDAQEALWNALERDEGERRQKVLELIAEGALKEAKKLATCGRQSVQLKCNDEFWAGGCGYEENYVPLSCDSRLCPDCMDSRLGEIVHTYLPRIREWDDPTFGTFTIENVSDVERGVDAAVGAFRRLRQRRIPTEGETVREGERKEWHWYHDGGDEPATGWKASLLRNGKQSAVRRFQQKYVSQGRQIPFDEIVKGGVYGVDIKQKGPDEFNIHIHALMDAHWIPQVALSAEWEQITGDPVVDIRRIYGRADDDFEDALMETAAYAAKPPEFETLEDEIEFVQTMKGRRFVQSFGSLHGNVPDLEGHLLCGRCENRPAGGWVCLGLVREHRDSMGSTHGADSHAPPPEQ